MIIKKLKLKNIRSYDSLEIEFTNGTTLLSGDIGAGKSTVLLAIEFSLFGLQRGELSGAGMLRHGEKEGSMELTFTVGNKEYQIKRFLKRTSSNMVTQDPGFLVIDESPIQLSPTELKQRVIDIIGYPQETLTKKSPIFRYTVFTPQENMKTILMADRESRIDTLRKVFDIDKYKSIRANAKIIIQELKNKRKEFASLIYDLEDKKEEVNQKHQKIAQLEIEKTGIDVEQIKKKIDQVKYDMVKLEEEMGRFRELKQELFLKDEKLRQLIEMRKRNNEKVESLQQKITQFESNEAPKYSPEQLKEERLTYLSTVEAFEQKAREVQEIIVRSRTQKDQASDLKNKIISLENCPTCLQKVSHEHKTSIASTQSEHITKINQGLETALHQERDIKGALESAKRKLEHLQEEQNKLRVLEERIKTNQETKSELAKIETEQNELREEIGQINQQKIVLDENIKKLDTVDYEYNIKKDELAKIQDQEREISIQYATKEKEISMLKDEIDRMNKEVNHKEKSKKKLERHSQVQDWLETSFTPMMSDIERHVMGRIKQEFDKLLQQWFSMLVDDENINVTIDEDFTPIIEQNGYTTDYDYLSGGERTAAALAYRLALNQTINTVISKINTKDLLILDEPTDGFSSEQMDKLREVLDQLKAEQIIIVSHESKIESYVDNIIRINKDNNISGIDQSNSLA